MQNSHLNNGTLALTYLPNLARPYDLELIFTEFGHQGAQFWIVFTIGHLSDQILWKKVQGH